MPQFAQGIGGLNQTPEFQQLQQLQQQIQGRQPNAQEMQQGQALNQQILNSPAYQQAAMKHQQKSQQILNSPAYQQAAKRHQQEGEFGRLNFSPVNSMGESPIRSLKVPQVPQQKQMAEKLRQRMVKPNNISSAGRRRLV